MSRYLQRRHKGGFVLIKLLDYLIDNLITLRDRMETR